MAQPVFQLAISVIARDEEASLPVLLASLDTLRARPGIQLVVLDTGSVDATQDVSAAFGAEVRSFAWRDDFSAARNHALGLCRSRWILWMDADDVLPAATAAWILENLENLDPEMAYAFRVISPGPGGSMTEFSQIRLIPAGRGLHFRNPVHESLGESIREAGLRVGLTGLGILHTGYRDPETVDRKHRRNLALLERAMQSASPSPSLILTFARMCLAMNRPAQAERSLRRVLPAVEPGSDIGLMALIHLGQSLLFQGRTREAVDIYRDGLSHGTANAQFLLEYGKALWLDQRPFEARAAWQACLRKGPAATSIPTDWETVIAGARRLLAETAAGAAVSVESSGAAGAAVSVESSGAAGAAVSVESSGAAVATEPAVRTPASAAKAG